MMINADARALAARGWTLRRFGLLAGAILSALSCRYHIAAGTPQVMGHVHASGIPPQAAAVLDVIWLQIAALLAGGGIAMAVAAFKTE